MPNDGKIVYWDACVFLSYINGMVDRMPILDAILENSANDDGGIKIYATALARVEVAFGAAEKEGKALDPEVERQIDDLWADPEAIVTVDYHDGIGAMARQLIRQSLTKGWSLKPVDAIHLATARWLEEVTGREVEFHTYSKDLPRFAALTGYRICQPYVAQQRLI